MSSLIQFGDTYEVNGQEQAQGELAESGKNAQADHDDKSKENNGNFMQGMMPKPGEMPKMPGGAGGAGAGGTEGAAGGAASGAELSDLAMLAV